MTGGAQTSIPDGPAPRPTAPPPACAPSLAPLLGLATLVGLLLIALAGGYGYHRDELYFLVAGDHLAWSYPDQGPLTPLVAHVINQVAPGSLTVLRIPSALMAAATVLLTGVIAAELGGRRRAQLIAAACAAVASVILVVGHLLSTTTFDVLAWTLVSWLVVRTIRTGEDRLWLAAGLVAGLALLDKPLIAFLLAGIGAGLLIGGPRRVLRTAWPWAGLLIALVIWSPWLFWQANHGWPQLDVSAAIAHGDSGSSQPRWALLPFQLLLVSPVLAPVWIAGLLALARRPALRPFRLFSVAWLFLVVVFLAAGGKPYYLAGMFPVLLGAGAIEADAWLDRRSRRARRPLLGAAIVISGVISAVIALPVLPAKDAGIVIAVNGDVGETIGWPELVRTVAGVHRSAGRTAVIFASNYGEAGAIDRYGQALGLPPAYSGHNGFADWGPPPDRPGRVLAVGFEVPELRSHFKGCRLAARVGNQADVHNDERDAPIVLCDATQAPWSQIWKGLRHLG